MCMVCKPEPGLVLIPHTADVALQKTDEISFAQVWAEVGDIASKHTRGKGVVSVKWVCSSPRDRKWTDLKYLRGDHATGFIRPLSMNFSLPSLLKGHRIPINLLCITLFHFLRMARLDRVTMLAVRDYTRKRNSALYS